MRVSHFACGQERLKIESWNLICGVSMKNKSTRIFSIPSNFSLQSYTPFGRFFYIAIISLWNHVNKIFRKPLELGLAWFLFYGPSTYFRSLNLLSHGHNLHTWANLHVCKFCTRVQKYVSLCIHMALWKQEYFCQKLEIAVKTINTLQILKK